MESQEGAVEGTGSIPGALKYQLKQKRWKELRLEAKRWCKLLCKQAQPKKPLSPDRAGGSAASSGGGQPAAVPAPLKQKSAREFVPSEDELDSMTTLLADFIGPVAKFIMEEHETKSTSANNLAAEISKEIPEQEKQAEFLRRWNMMSVSRRTLINKKRSDVPLEIKGPQSLPGQVQNKTGHDLVHYIGTIAKSLLRH